MPADTQKSFSNKRPTKALLNAKLSSLSGQAVVGFALVAIALLTTGVSLSTMAGMEKPLDENTRLAGLGNAHFHPEDKECIVNLTGMAKDMVYLNRSNILLTIPPKTGTRTMFEWLYRGVTGHPPWVGKICRNIVHNFQGLCWRSGAKSFHALGREERESILSSPDLLLIAVQRDPYDRVLSAFKSKFSCEHDRFHTNKAGNRIYVPLLRRHAMLPPSNTTCMTISEFAQALDRVRRNIGQPGFPSAIRGLESHLRPPDYMFDLLRYDMILDVADLSDVHVLQSIAQRLRFPHLVNQTVTHQHPSGFEVLDIPHETAAMLYDFATLTSPVPSKYLPGFSPSTWLHNPTAFC